jgi:hypothetical protein
MGFDHEPETSTLTIDEYREAGGFVHYVILHDEDSRGADPWLEEYGFQECA